ncbi:hypothetical protein E3N88_37265 [Mikania micrantha]|uniref:Retrotransposon Copia-like N-terminal domain-containing protein n=1 Tax=Mikania micrantha TaxID=192012 RepID=A0A5N6M634_9ASTR|nr:hypothetical protein E3N88_37265 [Mikania micrantha]
MASTRLHPALTVTNIKSHIPILLEKDSTHYSTWKTLFQVHCQAYEVIDHLSSKQPATPAPSSSDAAAAAKAEAAAIAAEHLWTRLDALVKQWIYATISQPLLRIIIQPGQTAHDAWTAVEKEFNDNQNTRAIFLGQEFANLSLDTFASMGDYCDHAKQLSDQLAAVGFPVDNRMLVLQVLTGLTEQYDSISNVLQNRDPLPSFSEVRSRLNQEELKKKRQVTRGSQSAAAALHTNTSTFSSQTPQPAPLPNSDRSQGRPRGGRGRGRGRQSNSQNRSTSQHSNTPAHPYIISSP